MLTDRQLLKDIAAVVEVSGRKTVCVTDVVFVLNRYACSLISKLTIC